MYTNEDFDYDLNKIHKITVDGGSTIGLTEFMIVYFRLQAFRELCLQKIPEEEIKEIEANLNEKLKTVVQNAYMKYPDIFRNPESLFE